MDGARTLRRVALALLATAGVVFSLTISSEARAADNPISTTAISAGLFHVCAIDNSGKVICWGGRNMGEKDVPLALGSVRQVASGNDYSCALTASGAASCWGLNDKGQASVPTDLGTAKKLEVGGVHTCAVKDDGVVRCWGDNFYQQATVPSDLGVATDITAGIFHTCAIKSDQTVRCWGRNSSSQAPSSPAVGTVKQLAAGYDHTCAVRTDDTPICWGSPAQDRTTIPAGVTTVKQIDVGMEHTCALRSDQTVQCWGANSKGQTTVPADLGAVSAITTGAYYTCAILVAGTPRCWGDDQYLQLQVPQGLETILKVDPAQCFPKGITIYNLKLRGKRVDVMGFARSTYIGKQITINFKPQGKKVVGRGVVAADGSFKVTVKAPKKKLLKLSSTRYRANIVDGESSPWFKLNRRMASNEASWSNGKLKIAGLLNKPLGKNLKLKTTVRTACSGPWSTVSTTKVKSSGKFSASINYPAAPSGVLFVRFATKVPKSAKSKKLSTTYSFVIPVVTP